MTDKKNPFGNGYFENPPEAFPEEPPSEPTTPKPLAMRGRDLKFAFDLLHVLNAHKLAERQGMSVPDNELFRKGLSPEKVVSVLAFITDLDLDLFGKHDFYNANVSRRTSTLAQFKGAMDETDFEVKPLVETFIPEEFSEEARARVFSLHMRILAAIADGRIARADVLADPDEGPPAVPDRNPFN